ncbi:ATP-binding protein [Cellulophaga sp. F20128]|uniref:ATP-binding response regulator n=1 Tax=Cellulophaga sp. F20128 TaxID=2926413 RepID=UPI001FF2BA9F|nr:ATP-binding protein [Cellulophaga sp. F20128]MCK0158152.1 ATP-binding protein [Cellulophaga sp. F20128]
MKIDSLQSTIAVLQEKLTAYSFDELSTEEACVLQDALNNFRHVVELSTSKQFLFIGEVNKPDYNKELTEVSAKGLSKQEFLHNLGGEDQLLVAKASNEIKTPLHGILGFADQLLDSNLNENQLSLVSAIQRTSYNMLEVSQDILEYSKLGAGLAKNEHISIKFYSAIRDVLFLCNTLILNTDLKLEVEIDPNIPEELLGDPSKLSQILLNLIGNAIQNTRAGEILLKAKVKEVYKNNRLLEFEVCDTSDGISDASLKNVFDPYKEKNEPHSGLGLSTVKQMVEVLGGEIYVSSRAGVGTVFTFTIPFKTAEKKVTNPEAISVKGLKILIFENKMSNQKTIAMNLDKWKCNSFVSDNCEKGLKIIEKHNIDVILIDLRVPNGYGLEIVECIRNHQNRSVQKIPIMAVSTDHNIKNKIKFDTDGFNDFLLKPYSSDELLLKLTNLKY